MEEINNMVLDVIYKNIEKSLSEENSKIIISKSNTDIKINTEELFNSLLNDDKEYEKLQEKIKKKISGFTIKNYRLVIRKLQRIFNKLKNCKVDIKDKNFNVKIDNNKIVDLNKKYLIGILNTCSENIDELFNSQNDLLWIIFVTMFLITISEKIINPLIILSMIYFIIYFYNKKELLDSDYFYIYNSLDKYLNITKIVEKKITDESKPVQFYGKADFYEVYKDKIILYKSNSINNSINQIKSDFRNNLKIYEFTKTTPNSGILSLKSNLDIKQEDVNVEFKHEILDSYVVDNPRVLNMVGFYTSELNQGKIVSKLDYKTDKNETTSEIDNWFLHETIVYHRKENNNNSYLLFLGILSFVFGVLRK